MIWRSAISSPAEKNDIGSHQTRSLGDAATRHAPSVISQMRLWPSPGSKRSYGCFRTYCMLPCSRLLKCHVIILYISLGRVCFNIQSTPASYGLAWTDGRSTQLTGCTVIIYTHQHLRCTVIPAMEIEIKNQHVKKAIVSVSSKVSNSAVVRG